jgi:WD40 repeat protein
MAEPSAADEQRASPAVPALKKSSALLWILLGVGFVLLLPACGFIGLIAYGFYWLDFSEDTKDPVIVGDARQDLPQMQPGFGGGPGGNGQGNPPKMKLENVRPAVPRILLDCKDSEIRAIFFTNSKTNQAAVYSQTEDGKHHVSRYDLGGNFIIPSFELIDPKPTGERKSLSPEGSLFAYEDAKGFVVICSAADGKKISSRMPYEKQEKEDPFANEHEALLARVEFIAEDRLLTVNQAGGLDLWSMPDFAPIHHVAARTKSSFVSSQWGLAFSFDRKVLAVYNAGGYDLIDTGSGELLRKTGPLPGDGTVKEACGVAFSADGSRLAACFAVTGANGETQAVLATYDVASGNCVRVTTGANFNALGATTPSVAWWGDKHLLVWGETRNQARVVDAETGKVLRRFDLGTRDQTGRFAALSPDNRLWYAAGLTAFQIAYLAGVEVPEDELQAGKNQPEEPLLLTADGIGKKQ